MVVPVLVFIFCYTLLSTFRQPVRYTSSFSTTSEQYNKKKKKREVSVFVASSSSKASSSSSMSGRRQARAQNKVGAGFGPSGGGGGGCGSVSSPSPSVQHLASMLNDLEVGQWQIPLANIRFTEHCRQTSPAAVSYIVDKIRQVGWMPTALPQVTLPGLNDGQIMTAELATTLEAFVLDGNHRLLAAREVFRDEPDKTITCTCYREITCTFTKKIISDGKKRRNSYNLVIILY